MARTNKTGVDWKTPIGDNPTRATYNSWMNMRARCNTDHPSWVKYYGDKGIKVCPEWENDFLKFVEDMGQCPHSTYSLDRIDSDGDYCKENCRWASPLLQALNRTYGDNCGVTQRPSGTWVARMRLGGKYLTLGTHEDIEIAKKYRRAAEMVIERLIEMEVLK